MPKTVGTNPLDTLTISYYRYSRKQSKRRVQIVIAATSRYHQYADLAVRLGPPTARQPASCSSRQVNEASSCILLACRRNETSRPPCSLPSRTKYIQNEIHARLFNLHFVYALIIGRLRVPWARPTRATQTMLSLICQFSVSELS